MLEKLKANPRLVVAILLSAGVIALLVGAGSNSDEQQTDRNEEQSQSQSAETPENSENEGEDNNSEPIGAEPSAGTVRVDKTDEGYTSTARKGDNQTVIVRQIVKDYLNEESKNLRAAQRLFMETNIVNSLPRNDHIFVGDKITVNENTLRNFTEAAESLSSTQQARWAAYL